MIEVVSGEIYFWTQFTGFMLQILPMIFLFFAPYQDYQMRMRKRTIFFCLCSATVLISILSSWGLYQIYPSDFYTKHVRDIGNIIFSAELIGGSIVYFCVLKKEVKAKILSYMMVFQYGVFLYTRAEIGAKFIRFRDQTGNPFLPYGVESIIIYTVATALTYPFAYWFMREFGTKHFRRVNKRNIFLISVSSILMCGLSVIGLLVEMILYRKMDSLLTNICLSVWLICMFLTDILGYFIYFRCLIIEEEKAEINLSLTAYDMQYQALYDKIAEEKRMRHNMRHHFRTIMTLAETGNQEELKEYIGKYLDEWEGFSEKRISRNEMVNAILSYYYTQAEERDIEVISDIELKENYPFDMTDMTVLLGNAMENAIEACGRCQSGRPCISVMMKQLKQVILIKIENSCRSTQSPVMDETGCTSTKEGRRIGYGMKSIDMIAKKYQGNMEFWKNGDTFTLRIVLNIPEEKRTLHA